jgi:hypothetical protein
LRDGRHSTVIEMHFLPAALRSTSLSVQRIGAVGALVLLMSLNIAWARPFYNWDMLPYVALAYRFQGASVVESHERVYEEVRRVVPPEQFLLLTEAEPYRIEVFRSPEAFGQQLPYHTVKPGYPFLISLLDRLGMSPVWASVALARAGYILTGIILLLWLWTVVPVGVAVVGAWVMMSLPSVIQLARLSSPDSLSTACVLAALYLFFAPRKRHVALAVLVVSLALRPDNLLWLGLLLAVWKILEEGRWRSVVPWAALGMTVYLVQAGVSGMYGWQTLFYVNFVERLPYPADAEVRLRLAEVVWAYLRQSRPSQLPPLLLAAVGIGAGVMVLRRAAFGWRDDFLRAVAVALVFTATHWALLPAEGRFFVAAYLTIFVAAMCSGRDWMTAIGARRTE